MLFLEITFVTTADGPMKGLFICKIEKCQLLLIIIASENPHLIKGFFIRNSLKISIWDVFNQ